MKRWYLAPALHDVTPLKITLLAIACRAEKIGSLGTESWTVRKKGTARLAHDLMKFLGPFVGAPGRGYLHNEITGKEVTEASIVTDIDRYRLVLRKGRKITRHTERAFYYSPTPQNPEE